MRKQLMVMMAGVMLAVGCTQHPKQEVVVEGLDPEEVRAALRTMVEKSGNRWMEEDLLAGKVEKAGDVCRIGRWSFDAQKKTFAFEHVNRSVTPPIFFGVSGVLERDAGGKLVARVTGGRKT